MKAIIKKFNDEALQALNYCLTQGYCYTTLKERKLDGVAIEIINLVEAEIEERKRTVREWFFNWEDEDGRVTGFNSVWAKDREEALANARAKESPAKDFTYEVAGGKVATGRFKGLYVHVPSLRAIDRDESAELTRMANMMTM